VRCDDDDAFFLSVLGWFNSACGIFQVQGAPDPQLDLRHLCGIGLCVLEEPVVEDLFKLGRWLRLNNPSSVRYDDDNFYFFLQKQNIDAELHIYHCATPSPSRLLVSKKVYVH
jgi:hypothetical protein